MDEQELTERVAARLDLDEEVVRTVIHDALQVLADQQAAAEAEDAGAIGTDFGRDVLGSVGGGYGYGGSEPDVDAEAAGGGYDYGTSEA